MTRPSLLLAALLVGTAAHGEPITGLPYLTDADTVTISGTRIRLAGIDAPERKQVCLDAKGAYWKCGEAARYALTAFAAGKTWTCELKAARDRYRRRVGVCAAVTMDGKRRSMDAYHGSIDINRWLVRSGWALDYPRYSHGAYAADQEAARVARRGLWAGAFHAPWNWRHRTCATTILGAVSVPIDARDKLCPRRRT